MSSYSSPYTRKKESELNKEEKFTYSPIDFRHGKQPRLQPSIHLHRSKEYSVKVKYTKPFYLDLHDRILSQPDLRLALSPSRLVDQIANLVGGAVGNGHHIFGQLRIEDRDGLELVREGVGQHHGDRQRSRAVEFDHATAIQFTRLFHLGQPRDSVADNLVVLGGSPETDLEGVTITSDVVCVHVFQNTTRESLLNISRTHKCP